MTCDQYLVDHISTELEFPAFLASAATLEAIGKDARKTFHSFMADHLSQWLPDFSKELKNHARVPAYRELAFLLETSVPFRL